VNYRRVLTSILSHVSPTLRRQLKSIYEKKPGFGRKTYYAQYGEDAFLQSYFQQKLWQSSCKEQMLLTPLRKVVEPGFYVDVGARVPILGSNTQWFYQHGWHGMNIDAAPGSMQVFTRKRPRDTNVEALVSDRETELAFYHWGTPCEMNTLSPEHARYFAQSLGREPTTITLHSRRLDNLLREHLSPNQPISFMSIDVEGHDLQVLRSNDWERFRPELVLVEDFHMSVDASPISAICQFMRGVDYEMYAWLRPTVVYRQIGLQDWLVPEYSTADAKS